MSSSDAHPLTQRILNLKPSLTPKAAVLADYVLKNPLKVILMTTKELSRTCGVSESTVVRFVAQLGFERYSQFHQTLRDMIDSDLPLPDRVEISGRGEEAPERLHRLISDEIDNLKQLYKTLDPEATQRVVELLAGDQPVYVVGARISYPLAYYLGWSLTKLRSGVTILRGSDSMSVDWLTIAPPHSLVIIITVSRYPNNLIRLAKLVRRLGHSLVVMADNAICPLAAFAHHFLVAPSRHIPLIGSPGTLLCLANYLTYELAGRDNPAIRDHQARLEATYREHDIFFNIGDEPR